MKHSTIAVIALLALGPVRSHMAAEGRLEPLMAQPEHVVLQDDFSEAGPVKKDQWSPRQGTQWVIEGGVLRGRPSTKEFQAKRKDHFGYEPRVSVPVTPPQFIARFSVRFAEGSETAIVPFVEFGHHVCRAKFSKDGLAMVAEHESALVAEAKGFHYEPGKWYELLAEMKGDEVVLQIAGGPTLYAKHACFAKPNPSGGNGLGIAGPKDGVVEIDNVTIWSVKADSQAGWATTRGSLPKIEPKIIKAVKK